MIHGSAAGCNTFSSTVSFTSSSLCKMVCREATAGSSLSLSHDETPDSSSGGFAGGALHAGGLPVQGRGTLARGKAGSVMKQLIWAEIVPPLDGGGIERRTVGDRCVRFYRPLPPLIRRAKVWNGLGLIPSRHLASSLILTVRRRTHLQPRPLRVRQAGRG